MRNGHHRSGGRAGLVRTARGHRGGPEGWEVPGGHHLEGVAGAALQGGGSVRRTRLRDGVGGSITLTSGVLAQEPMQGTAAISLVNGALESFTRAAALEMPRGIRINVVSPPWVDETLKAFNMKGIAGMPAEQVARAYVRSIEGSDTGQIIDARKFAAQEG